MVALQTDEWGPSPVQDTGSTTVLAQLANG